MHWIDTTNYARDEKTKDGKVPKPRTWECSLGGYVRVVVTRGHVNYPGQWIMHLHPLFTEEDLHLPDVAAPEVAQARAVEMVRDVLNLIEKDLR